MTLTDRLGRVGLGLLLLAGMTGSAAAADAGETALRAIFGDPAHGPLPLAAAAGSAGPEAEIRSALRQLEERYGTLQSVEPTGANYTVRLATADLSVSLALDEQQRVRSLRVTAIVPRGMTLATFAAALGALPGQTSLLVTRDGHDLYAHDADTPLAVGSAFKLVVLRAVMEAVAAGRMSWSEVVTLDGAQRSLPTGFLQTWPAGTPVTVATLANAMISVSDNTAADSLARLVGEDALDAISPRNAPFLTTRTMFALRSGEMAEAAHDWRTADGAARRALAARALGLPLPSPASLRPVGSSGAEWYLSPRELCELLAETREAPAFQINPGPASPGDWRSVAFKGGGDEGVLDLSVLAVAQDGHTVCVTATWNNATVALEQLAGPISGLLHALAHVSEGPPP